MPEMPEVENIVVGIKDFIENKKNRRCRNHKR